MPCFQSGVPTSQLAHYQEWDLTTNGSAQVINIAFVATRHMVMEQMIAHWEAVPATSEPITLSKISAIDPRLNTILRSVDPSVAGENLTDLACIVPFYWEVGDTVQIDYLNTDDQAVGVEIMLVEVR